MKPKASKSVTDLLDIGWSPLCDGLVAATDWYVERRPGEGKSHRLDIYAGERHIQICVSPTGRSVRVYVDGEEA